MPLQITAWIILGLFLVVVVGYFVSGRTPRGGFRDWIKDPSYKQSAQAYFDARNSLTVPDDISDAEIERMVELLFVPENENFNFERLQLVGEKAATCLIAALVDPRTKERRFEVSAFSLEPRSPLERICRLLSEYECPQAVPPLVSYIDHPDEEFRKHAAMTLGQIGSEECIEPVLKALADLNDSVQTFALHGIAAGITSGRSQRVFLDAIFPALSSHIEVSGLDCRRAAKLLLRIDAERAAAILLSPEHFTIENPQVWHILTAFNQQKCQVPLDRLLPILIDARPRIQERPYARVYGESLIAYARNPDAETEGVLQTALQLSHDKVSESAAEALCLLAGLAADLWRSVCDLIHSTDFSSVAKPVQTYFAVKCYCNEVNNGGHLQYFVNASGGQWKTALEGLREIGASGRAEILGYALSAYAPQQPSEDDITRHQQTSRASQSHEKFFKEADDRFYACAENTAVLLFQFALRFRESFPPADDRVSS